MSKKYSAGYGAMVMVLLVIAGLLTILGVDDIGGFPVTDAGNFAFGYLAAGDFSIGVFAAGTFAVGIFAAGIFSIGIFSIGIFSIGIFSVGMFALGAFATQRYMGAQRAEKESQAEKKS